MSNAIIVTGAAGNLGRAVTQKLLNEGMQVYATLGPRDNPDFMTHENLQAESVNLMNDEAVRKYVDEVMNGLSDGATQALLCIVGGYTAGNIYETEAESVRKMIQLNFESAYLITHHLFKACKDRKTPLQVIFVGGKPAIEAEQGVNQLAYGLSKSLLFKLAEYINVESNQSGITASVIVPSVMDTPGTRAAMPDADPSAWVPTQRVADTVSFILSDAGKMMRQPIYKIYNQA